MNQQQIQNEIERLTNLQDLANRKNSILKLMRVQRVEFLKSDLPYEPDRENCSLVDMYTCQFVGSGVCVRCSGWTGRADGYSDED